MIWFTLFTYLRLKRVSNQNLQFCYYVKNSKIKVLLFNKFYRLKIDFAQMIYAESWCFT